MKKDIETIIISVNEEIDALNRSLSIDVDKRAVKIDLLIEAKRMLKSAIFFIDETENI